MNYYGDIDLVALGNAVRKHPEAVKKFTRKDGTQGMSFPYTIYENERPDEYGNTHVLKLRLPAGSAAPGEKTIISNIKPSRYDAASQAAPGQAAQGPIASHPQQQPQNATPAASDELPF